MILFDQKNIFNYLAIEKNPKNNIAVFVGDEHAESVNYFLKLLGYECINKHGKHNEKVLLEPELIKESMLELVREK